MHESNFDTKNPIDRINYACKVNEDISTLKSKLTQHYQLIAFLFFVAWVSTIVLALNDGYDKESVYSNAVVGLCITVVVATAIHLRQARCARRRLKMAEGEMSRVYKSSRNDE